MEKIQGLVQRHKNTNIFYIVSGDGVAYEIYAGCKARPYWIKGCRVESTLMPYMKTTVFSTSSKRHIPMLIAASIKEIKP